jgi:hypothetical protein
LTSPVTIGALTLNSSNATLWTNSTLTTTHGIDLRSGTLSGVGGGIYAITGGGTTAVTMSGSGILNGVQINGALAVTGYGATARFNGLTVKDTAGTGPGVINVTGYGASLQSTATQTLDNATVHLGRTSGPGRISTDSGSTNRQLVS